MNNNTQTRSRTRQHDENAAIGPARMTRAKAAATGYKPALESKVSSTNSTSNNTATAAANASRKRAALGDLSNNPNKDSKGNNNNNNAKPSLVSLKSTASTQAKARPPAISRQPTLAPQAKVPAGNQLKSARTRHIQATKQQSKIEESRVVAKKQIQRPSSSTNSSALPIPVYTQKDEEEEVAKTDQKKSHKLDEAVEDVDQRPAKRAKVTQDWDDLDAEDLDDPLMVSEYAPEIFDFLYDLQKTYMPNPNYMDDQKNLKWEYRSILVDWLVEVHTKFRQLPETLFLAVNIVDRFMSVRVVSLAKVQLVGIASLFIAAKFEEVFTPPIKSYAYVTDGGYNEDEILNAERFVLQVLNFELSYPNPMNFLRRISKADNYDLETRTIGKYLLEISLFDYRLLKFLPSDIAAAAMFLSREILGRGGDWDANMVHYSGDCDEAKMEPIVALMVDYLQKPVSHESFFKKYASKRFMKASIVARNWAKQHVNEYPIVSSSD